MSQSQAEVLSVTQRQDDSMLSFVMSVNEARRRVQELQQFVQDVMVATQDYGTIPGTPKPTLLKPGAEKLCEIYGLAPTIDITNRTEDWEKGFFHYEVCCRLISKRTGIIVAEGVGSANSREKRYKNQDAYTLVNTILKMAKKRALVDAALSATRSSGLFTQDIEDSDLDTENGERQANHRQSSRQGSPANADATEAQRKKIYALVKSLSWTSDMAIREIESRFGKKSTKALTKNEASGFIEYLTQLTQAPADSAPEAQDNDQGAPEAQEVQDAGQNGGLRDFKDMTLDELRGLAKGSVAGYAKLSKDELIRELEAHWTFD